MTAKTKRKPKAKAKVRTNNITIHIDGQAFKTAVPKAGPSFTIAGWVGAGAVGRPLSRRLKAAA